MQFSPELISFVPSRLLYIDYSDGTSHCCNIQKIDGKLGIQTPFGDMTLLLEEFPDSYRVSAPHWNTVALLNKRDGQTSDG
ncbi:unnamed protein product [Enterobius vermicularis]|uniref:Tudor domain-containing protein n=1 Tax=Enterobius vermicularis TaxID=51028 RepID=A0A0N4V458_ENTVE|nr:unnamed protein product [Enterobius vermicularis]